MKSTPGTKLTRVGDVSKRLDQISQQLEKRIDKQSQDSETELKALNKKINALNIAFSAVVIWEIISLIW